MDSISTYDFNEQLYKMLSESIVDSEQDNLCLITNKKLNNNFIKLNCGHKFNYESIFNEVKNQKKYNQLEVCHLKRNEIKCPYCRTIQKGLLPYCDEFPKIKYVNHPHALQCLPNSCIYAFLSGKRKGEFCGKGCSNKYCASHEKIMEKREAKKFEKEKKKLQKKEKKLLKENVKLKKQLIKENIKLKKEIKKEKNKLLNKKSKLINEIVGKNAGASQICDDMLVKIDEMLEKLKVNAQKSNVKKSKPVNNPPKTEWVENTCSYVFKRGKNKGLQCKCKKPFKYSADLSNPTFEGFLCKRHYQQSLKSHLQKENTKIKIKNVKVTGKKTIIQIKK